MERRMERGRQRRKRAAGERGHADALRLTRRQLLAVGAGTALVLGGCAPSTRTSTKPSATRVPFRLDRPATLAADGTIPAALAEAAPRLLAGRNGIPSTQPATAPAAADLILSFGEVPAGYRSAAVGASAATVLTHLRLPLESVTLAQLQGLLAGTTTDWRSVGAPSTLPVRVFALDGVPLPSGLTLASGAQRVPTVAALVDALRTHEGSLAVAPVEAADWSLRNLGVDGVYPAQGRGSQAATGLAPFTLRLGASQALVDRGLGVRALAAALASTLAAATPTFDVAVAGDIILGRGVNNKMVAYNDYLYPYRKVRDEFLLADWRIANLECTITDLVPPPTDPSTFTFITAKKAVDGLVYSGIQTVGLANNHADNGGVPAFLDMVQTLRERGLTTCGGGSTLAEARQPVIQTVKGVRVALLAYNEIPPGGPYATETSGGIAPIDVATLPQDLANARKQADVVIPFFHWGIEYTKDPTRHQQDVARAAIDAGADMVLGSHPHWIQGIESYKGRLIVYCLGNFIFDQDWSVPTQEGSMLHLYWRGTTLAGVRFVPYRIMDRCQPNLISHADATDIFDRMWTGTDMLARGQYGPEN